MAQNDTDETSNPEMTNAANSLTYSKRSMWQFSLLSLFLFVTVFGCLLGWIASKRMESYRQTLAWNALIKAGGHGGSAEIRKHRNSWQRMLFGDDSHAHLRFISISASKDADSALPHLAAFPEVNSLILEQANVTDAGLAYLSGHKKLKKLSLIKTQVTDQGLLYLSNLTELEELYLGGNPQITEEGLQHLRKLTKLKMLGLDDTQITDDGFLADVANFKELEALYLMRTSITDKSIVHISGLNKLSLLWINDTLLTQAGLENLKQSLPKCGINYSHQSIK